MVLRNKKSIFIYLSIIVIVVILAFPLTKVLNVSGHNNSSSSNNDMTDTSYNTPDTSTSDSNDNIDNNIVINPLKIQGISCYEGDEDEYEYAKGYVKNVGNTSHSYIKVKVTYTDDSGNVVDTDWTYAGSDNLQPGERKSFEIMTSYNKNMKKCSLKIESYQ